MKSRFDELLPFYVNGTLNSADRDWIDSYLREHPLASNEMHWLRAVQRATQEEAVPVSSEVGLERAMQRIRAGRAAASPALASSWMERLRDGLSRLVAPTMIKPALASALAVVALQAVIIASMVSERDETSDVRGKPGSVVEQGPYVKVNFKPDATEADIRMLLIDVQASIASGPGQLGDYYVRVPAWQVDTAVAQLGASTIVEGVAVVDALPARP